MSMPKRPRSSRRHDVVEGVVSIFGVLSSIALWSWLSMLFLGAVGVPASFWLSMIPGFLIANFMIAGSKVMSR